MHVDSLDTAAGLTGVVERTVDEVCRGPLDVGVAAHVRGVFAPKLERSPDEPLRSGGLDGMTASNRAGERHKCDPRVGDYVGNTAMIEIENLKDAGRQPGLLGRSSDPFSDERRLLRVLEHDRIARDERRHQGVDRGQPRVVPWRDYENDA